jgi:hypothetical protein
MCSCHGFKPLLYRRVDVTPPVQAVSLDDMHAEQARRERCRRKGREVTRNDPYRHTDKHMMNFSSNAIASNYISSLHETTKHMSRHG